MDDVTASVAADASMSFRSGSAISYNRCNIVESVCEILSEVCFSSSDGNGGPETEEDGNDCATFFPSLFWLIVDGVVENCLEQKKHGGAVCLNLVYLNLLTWRFDTLRMKCPEKVIFACAACTLLEDFACKQIYSAPFYLLSVVVAIAIEYSIAWLPSLSLPIDDE